MKNIFKNFIGNSGLWVMVATIISKTLAFLMMIFLVRNVPKDDFGLLTVALNFVAFFIPAIGFGSAHGMIRFGSQKDDCERELLRSYAFKKGFRNQIILSFGIILIGYILNSKPIFVFNLISIMIIRLVGIFFLEQAKAELKAELNNRKFAQIEILTNILAVILGVVFTIKWGVLGYVISLSIYPFSVFLMHRFRFSNISLSEVFVKEFWTFSIQSVITLVIFMWVFLLDVFFVGKYFSPKDVAFYKISTIVPMNLILISQIYTQTMYPEMCRNSNNKGYLKEFVKNYFIIFVPLTTILVLCGFIFAEEIMMVFGSEYHDTSIIKIMFLQMASCILLRVPFGNLMSATGDITASLVIGIGMLVAICIASFVLLPKGNPQTEAVISLVCVTLGGISAALYFKKKLSVLK